MWHTQDLRGLSLSNLHWSLCNGLGVWSNSSSMPEPAWVNADKFFRQKNFFSPMACLWRWRCFGRLLLFPGMGAQKPVSARPCFARNVWVCGCRRAFALLPPSSLSGQLGLIWVAFGTASSLTLDPGGLGDNQGLPCRASRPAVLQPIFVEPCRMMICLNRFAGCWLGYASLENFSSFSYCR